ncbi:oligosaccharide flippase family protein [Sutcliffiella horikoshii]|uniref:lipopolysaccharide biosynthesis protein n=1 Tax=Sutcliffiella horikoshii TaxID=79883 RepID=UPI001CBFDFC9|nr:oligosaccharide flippase family protein [Sutcliffiella horikoshii]UAL46930.1 oligosaccharide flippase family protein [Sutcliffiella horikoshii]
MKNNQLKSGIILSYLTLILGNSISLIYTPLMLRYLGQSEYGLYSLSLSIISLIGILNFGFGSAVIRYTSKYRAMGEKSLEYSLNGMFLLIFTLIGTMVIVVGHFLISNIDLLFGNSMSITELSKMKTLISILVFNTAASIIFGFFSLIITAYERFIFLKLVALLQAIITPMLIILILVLGYTSIGMVLLTTSINLIILIINCIYCLKILKVKITFNRVDIKLIKEILNYCFYIFLILIVDKLFWSTDQFILGIISGTSSVAVYSIGATFTNYFMAFSTAFSGVYFPKITQMVTNKVENKELSALFIRTGRLQFIILSIIIGGFIVVGKEFIITWAGKEYIHAYYLALIVMIPLCVPLTQTIGIAILQAKNMHRFRSVIYLAIAILNLLLSVPLAQKYGYFGCALATSVSILIGHIIIMNIYYYKKIKLDIPVFFKNMSLLLIPLLLSVIVSVQVKNFDFNNEYWSIITTSMVFLVLYLILSWLFVFNDYEKTLFKTSISKFRLRSQEKVSLDN